MPPAKSEWLTDYPIAFSVDSNWVDGGQNKSFDILANPAVWNRGCIGIGIIVSTSSCQVAFQQHVAKLRIWERSFAMLLQKNRQEDSVCGW